MSYILHATLPTIAMIVSMAVVTEPGIPEWAGITALLVTTVACAVDATTSVTHGWFYGKPNAKGVSLARWFTLPLVFVKMCFGCTNVILLVGEITSFQSYLPHALSLLPNGSWTAIFLIAYANLAANLLFTLYMKDHDRAREALKRRQTCPRNQ